MTLGFILIIKDFGLESYSQSTSYLTCLFLKVYKVSIYKIKKKLFTFFHKIYSFPSILFNWDGIRLLLMNASVLYVIDYSYLDRICWRFDCHVTSESTVQDFVIFSIHRLYWQHKVGGKVESWDHLINSFRHLTFRCFYSNLKKVHLFPY